METLSVLAAYQGLDLVRRQFDTPEWRHRAEAMAAREPWRQRFMRQVKRLQALASEPWPSWEQRESYR